MTPPASTLDGEEDPPVPEASSNGITIVDTTELRWFADGAMPLEVLTWFTGHGSMAAIEERCDSYRIDDRDDAGLKRRFRQTLELKVRQATGEMFILEPGLTAPLEDWRRWSPADGQVDLQAPETWIDVCKVVYKRRFLEDGTEIPWSKVLPAGADVGCDVEITSVRVADIEAWTFALAAFGSDEHRRHALRIAWHGLGHHEPRPEGLVQLLRRPCGYPEWLNHIVYDGRRLLPEGSTRPDPAPDRDSVDLV